ncbi:hypothetical protein CROQUDRAFT_90689 [Cronartium quercuum f. sp. fusiforme G11]|uniref:Uncharacterized protein n=1 Tax=Cronartium quercuum f. sp. fusiforme G11 TaxID=708437 RepID=A0A9P6TDX3_9BASI|nr:hypothetical protein CROQUDRAFT_90689 [Cronartium quercuum f. sp. fusiforme G11]
MHMTVHVTLPRPNRKSGRPQSVSFGWSKTSSTGEFFWFLIQSLYTSIYFHHAFLRSAGPIKITRKFPTWIPFPNLICMPSNKGGFLRNTPVQLASNILSKIRARLLKK